MFNYVADRRACYQWPCHTRTHAARSARRARNHAARRTRATRRPEPRDEGGGYGFWERRVRACIRHDPHPLGRCDPPCRLCLCVELLRHWRPWHPLALGRGGALPAAHGTHGAVVRLGGPPPHLSPPLLFSRRALVPLCAAPHRAGWLLGHPVGRVWRLPRARLPAGGCGAEPLLWPRAHPRGVRAADCHAGGLFCRQLLRPGRGHGGECRGLRGAVPLRRRDLPRGGQGWGTRYTGEVRHVQGRGRRAAAKARAQQALQHVQPLRCKVRPPLVRSGGRRAGRARTHAGTRSTPPPTPHPHWHPHPAPPRRAHTAFGSTTAWASGTTATSSPSSFSTR